MPKPGGDKGSHPTLSQEIIQAILELKRELPSRSAFKILTMLILAGKTEEGTMFHPAGKGKIEDFWKYVQSSFLPEIRNHKVKSLGDLNDLFFAWLKTEYTDRPHSSLDDDGKLLSPQERWQKDIRSGIRLKYLSPLQLDEIFFHETVRVVDKYGIIPFEDSGMNPTIINRIGKKRLALVEIMLEGFQTRLL